MGKKKKFFDKKKSATFQLMARDSSAAAPTAGDGGGGTSSDRVFVRVDQNDYSVKEFEEEEGDDDDYENDAVSGDFSGGDDDGIFADAPDDNSDGGEGVVDGSEKSKPRSKSESKSNKQLPDHVRREILELGFPDDGYNYLLHLREIKNAGAGSAFYQNPKAQLEQLPRDVKAYDASRVEVSKLGDNSYENSLYSVASKTVGVRLQKAFDPEVAALLDDSDLSRFGSDDEDLEEDFVVNANLPAEGEDLELEKLRLSEETQTRNKESNKSNDYALQGDVVDRDGTDKVRNVIPGGGTGLNGEKSRVRRPLDDQFDLLELREYGTDSEDEFDADSFEEDENGKSLAEKLNDAFTSHKMDDGLVLYEKREKEVVSLDSSADVIQRSKEYAKMYENDDDERNNVVILEESSDESEKWDCETIVSTYSNLDNHPGKIGAPQTRRQKRFNEPAYGTLSGPANTASLKTKEKLAVDLSARNKNLAAVKVKDGSNLSSEPQKRDQCGLESQEKEAEKGNILSNDEQKRKQHGQESKEEKKERKAAVKQERREARRLKKEFRGLYKSESHQAQKVAASTGPASIHLL